MDEILDRIKSNIKNFKVKHKHLVALLIATEIFGILVFLWILRVPLYEKFFTLPPKAYSLTQMDPQKNYLLTQGDFLTGQINPDNTLAILVWDKNQVQQRVKLKPDSQGNWNYQLPINLNPGIMIVTVGELDASNNAWSINNYRIRVKSRDMINLNKTNNSPLTEDAIPAPEEISKTAFDMSINQDYSLPLNTFINQPQEE